MNTPEEIAEGMRQIYHRRGYFVVASDCPVPIGVTSQKYDWSLKFYFPEQEFRIVAVTDMADCENQIQLAREMGVEQEPHWLPASAFIYFYTVVTE